MQAYIEIDKCFKGFDYWAPGKRMLMDASFLERLLQVDAYEVPEEKIRLIHDDIISQGDWDVFHAAKAFPPSEAICQWIAALCSFHLKKLVN